MQWERPARRVQLGRPAPQAVRGESARLARWAPQALLAARPARQVRKAPQERPARRVRGDTQALQARPAPGVRQAREVKRGRKAQ